MYEGSEYPFPPMNKENEQPEIKEEQPMYRPLRTGSDSSDSLSFPNYEDEMEEEIPSGLVQDWKAATGCKCPNWSRASEHLIQQQMKFHVHDETSVFKCCRDVQKAYKDHTKDAGFRYIQLEDLLANRSPPTANFFRLDPSKTSMDRARKKLSVDMSIDSNTLQQISPQKGKPAQRLPVSSRTRNARQGSQGQNKGPEHTSTKTSSPPTAKRRKTNDQDRTPYSSITQLSTSQPVAADQAQVAGRPIELSQVMSSSTPSSPTPESAALQDPFAPSLYENISPFAVNPPPNTPIPTPGLAEIEGLPNGINLDTYREALRVLQGGGQANIQQLETSQNKSQHQDQVANQPQPQPQDQEDTSSQAGTEPDNSIYRNGYPYQIIFQRPLPSRHERNRQYEHYRNNSNLPSGQIGGLFL